MRNSQKKYSALKFILTSCALGGGFYLFKKRADKIKYYKSIDKDEFLHEITEILIAHSKYTYELLTIDAPTIKRKEVEDILELESIKSFYEFYVNSKGFKFKETRELTKKIFLYNVKVIEKFLGNADEEDFDTIKSSMACELKNIIKITKFYDLELEIENNEELQYIVKREEDCIIEHISKGCYFTRFIIEESGFC